MPNHRTRNTPLALALAAAGYGLALTSPAFAQQGWQLEEIVVTATKREATVQELPFSINAQSAADIARSGATNIEELSRNIAGLSIQNLGPGQSQIGIRGVSAGQIVRDQPGVKEQVGVYLDESVISLSLFTPDVDLYDMNRVETLRGPQGTLFGSGSIGGTIRFISNQPTLEEFSGSLEGDINTVADGEEGGHLRGHINVPLGDMAALRVVAYSTQYAGYIDALGEGGSKKADVNSGARNGARVALTIEPTENLSITPRWMHQEIETDGFNRQEVFNLFANRYTTTRPAISLDDREQYLLLDEGFKDDTDIADLVTEWSGEYVDITLINSYMQRDILVSRDGSALTGSVSISIGGAAAPEAWVLLPSNLRDTTDLEQTTHELRFASNGDGKLQWLLGAFRADIQRDYAQRLPTPGYDVYTDLLLGEGTSAAVARGYGPDSPYNSDLSYDIEQTAYFGEANYRLFDRLVLTAGVRYHDFEEQRSIYGGGLFSDGWDQTDATESDGWTPRFMASYALSDSTTLNAQASKGFRLGGVNDPLNSSICEPADLAAFGGFQAYEDETLWNVEAGFKSRFGNGVVLNAAAFYTNIEDLQVTLDAGSCSSRISFNVPEAHTAGVELEFSANATENLELSLSGTLLEAEFDATVRAANGSVLGGVEDGNRLASVPELQFAAAATYVLASPLWRSEETYLSATLQYVGERYTQPSDQLPGAGDFVSNLPFGGASGTDVTRVDLALDDYQTLNLRAGLRYPDWEIAAYINNATDENAELAFDRERGGRARLAYHVNQPRTIGLTARMFFE